jgi:radical SAM protein with 4Fe4S-binding SPASM domain
MFYLACRQHTPDDSTFVPLGGARVIGRRKGWDPEPTPELRMGARKVDALSRSHPLHHLLWETTQKCNLNCKHCGSSCTAFSDRTSELTLNEITDVFREISSCYRPSSVFVGITGGEPLCREDLFEATDCINSLGFNWGMVTNGYDVTEDVVDLARRTGMKSLSISLDGARPETHNWLRGREDSFQRALNAVNLFSEANFLRVLEVITVVHKHNIGELGDILNLLRGLGVRRWRVTPVFPSGRATAQQNFLLRGAELRSLLDFVKDTRRIEKDVQVSFSEEGYLGLEYEHQVRDYCYACLSGITVATILANGDVTGCADLPRSLVQGNVREDTFRDIWENRFSVFRDRSWMRVGNCIDCQSWTYCRGNSLHLWNHAENVPKVCHLQLLDGSKSVRPGER